MCIVLIVILAYSSTNNIIQFFCYGSQTIIFFCFGHIFQYPRGSFDESTSKEHASFLPSIEKRLVCNCKTKPSQYIRGNFKTSAKCAKRWAQWLSQRLEAALSCGERRCQRQCVHIDAHLDETFAITSFGSCCLFRNIRLFLSIVKLSQQFWSGAVSRNAGE